MFRVLGIYTFDPPPQSSGMAQRNLLMKLDIQLPIPILVRVHNGLKCFLKELSFVFLLKIIEVGYEIFIESLN